ncbi:MAG: hypothetical protein NTZ17_10115 [Phycisphaerae bacterium]|nr:hypothetical protein [Phycisphaerae bacterium]
MILQLEQRRLGAFDVFGGFRDEVQDQRRILGRDGHRPGVGGGTRWCRRHSRWLRRRRGGAGPRVRQSADQTLKQADRLGDGFHRLGGILHVLLQEALQHFGALGRRRLQLLAEVDRGLVQAAGRRADLVQDLLQRLYVRRVGRVEHVDAAGGLLDELS